MDAGNQKERGGGHDQKNAVDQREHGRVRGQQAWWTNSGENNVAEAGEFVVNCVRNRKSELVLGRKLPSTHGITAEGGDKTVEFFGYFLLDLSPPPPPPQCVV